MSHVSEIQPILSGFANNTKEPENYVLSTPVKRFHKAIYFCGRHMEVQQKAYLVPWNEAQDRVQLSALSHYVTQKEMPFSEDTIRDWQLCY